jgi:glycosyltransferase involved in cell wall biosynthesis
MKKVLLIAPYTYLPYFSGGQKFIAQFCEYLGKEIELTVVSVAENDFSLAKTYRTVAMLKKPFSRYYDIGLISKLTKLIRENKFDTVIWEHPYYAWLAFIIRKKTGVRTIIQTHNIEHTRFKSTGKWWWPILQRYEKWAFKKADAIFFITPDDKAFAIQQWKIDSQKCLDLPFGVEIKKHPDDHDLCRKEIAEKHHIDNEKILLFNGWLAYKPNLDALKVIIGPINDILLNQPGFNYKILICGKGLPDELENLSGYTDKNIIYAGFVENIENYFKAADIFLNPVQSGGGIKTKMVEAIAFGTTVVATETGATGIDRAVCGNKLVVVADNEWNAFAKAIIAENSANSTPDDYYKKYSWESIAKNIVASVM